MSKSCVTCPSYTHEVEAHTVFDKQFGASLCARFGRVLGRPGMSAEQLDRIAVDIASSCDSHGKPRPSRPVAAELKVALPAQTALFGAADL
ncbi:MAG TPA: hypothetical protein VGP24_05905, partial [Glaciihabitans sp.]|nr:hypothetical protein [Glaciihabitans sp.]